MDAVRLTIALLCLLLVGCAGRAKVSVVPNHCAVKETVDCTIDDTGHIQCVKVTLTCQGYEVKK